MSIEKEHVYLLNNGPHDAIVELSVRQSASSPTVRSNATQPVVVVVPHGRMLDITSRLEVPRERALSILAQSEDLRRFGPRLSVIDGASHAHEVDQLSVRQPDNKDLTVVVGLSTAEYALAPVTVSAAALWQGGSPVLTQHDEKTGKLQVEVKPGSGHFEVPNPSQAASDQPDPQDDIPSIAWKRERLAEKAKQMGIEVTATTSKAAILRAIRAKS